MIDKAEIIAQAAEAGKTIEHSRWGNRVWYLWAFTLAVMGMLAAAVWLDKPLSVIHTLAGLLAFAAFLLVVTPSAEQVTKMLAQVAAIRAGARSN